jgi:hypothetical protein
VLYPGISDVVPEKVECGECLYVERKEWCHISRISDILETPREMRERPKPLLMRFSGISRDVSSMPEILDV